MGSSPPIREDIKINDELKALEVIEFYKEGTVLTIEFSNKRLLQFEIDKSSIQKTYQNLEKAAEAIDFDAGILANAKYIFGKKYSQYFKLPEQQTQEQESKATEDSDVRQHNVFKYSTDIPLAEQIKLGEDYVFLQIINNKAVISPSIDLSKTKKIILYPRDKTPILDFEYESVEEINHLIEVAKSKTIDDIYFTSKAIWQKFVKATHEQIVLLTADSIFTFFQDSFVTTHYVMLVAHVGSGKGAILITFSYLGYRVVLAGNMSGGSILDLLGSLEMGQVVIAEDELNNLKSDSDKWNLYTLGYDAFGETTRTLDGSTTKRSINFYPAFSYKIFGAETSLDTSGLQGLIDRTFQTNLLKGKPDFYIKNLRKRRLSTDYTSLLSEIVSFRKLMLIYRLIHADHLFNEVKTNIDGRPLELTGPIIDLFHGLSEDKTSLNEIVPVLSSFLRQKGEIKEETFDNILFKIVKEICGYCRDKLHARSSKVDNIRYQHFIKTKIEELKSLYQVVTEIELLDGTLGRKYSVLGGKGENLTQTDTQQTTVETDILQQPTKDIVNISTIKQSETLQRPENEANNTAKTSLSLLKEDISVPPSRAYTGGVQQVLGTYVAFDLEWDATADNRIDAVSFVDSNGWSEAKLREHDYDGSEYQLLHHILLTLTKYQWSMGWNTQSNPQNAANLNTLDLRILCRLTKLSHCGGAICVLAKKCINIHLIIAFYKHRPKCKGPNK